MSIAILTQWRSGGVLFGALAWRFQLDWALPAFLLLVASLLAIAVIDLEHYIVPNRILVVVVPATVGLVVLAVNRPRDMAPACAARVAAEVGVPRMRA